MVKAGKRLLAVKKCSKCLGENWRKLRFCRKHYFIRESTEAAVCRFSVINSQENTRDRVELNIKLQN